MNTGEPARVTTVAAIDAGTNSVHLLVALVDGRDLRILANDKAYLRLEPAIESGRLGVRRGELVAALADFCRAARDLGAERIAVVGTEPFRRVDDAAEAADELARAAGFELAILSHEEEGLLTLLGVTLGAPIEHELLVADVGGGSSELVAVGPVRSPTAVGLPLGTARLMATHVCHDPPTSAEMAAMRSAASQALTDAPATDPHEIVAVGGAVTNLLGLAPGAAKDRWLDATRLDAALDRLTSQPASIIAERYGIHPVRAHTLPAGAAIVFALLERYRITRITISEASLREGLTIALARVGDDWRAALRDLLGGSGEEARTVARGGRRGGRGRDGRRAR
jgi:exopolyphosphatase/guanosine-5'-triphosphate,3'-diphosphate pyrophosphatase